MDLERLEKIAEGLALAFYVLMFVALVMGLAGSVGSGFWMLILGSCAHVGQAALTEFVAGERAPGARPKPEAQARSERVQERALRAQRAARAKRAAPPLRDRVSVRPGR